MTFAILNFSGRRPVARDWLKICLRGDRISVETFLRIEEEIPVMSGVFLFSSFFMQDRISRSVTGEWCISKVDSGGGGSGGSGSVTGWIVSAVCSAMVVKYRLKALAIVSGSVMRVLLVKSE